MDEVTFWVQLLGNAKYAVVQCTGLQETLTESYMKLQDRSIKNVFQVA